MCPFCHPETYAPQEVVFENAACRFIQQPHPVLVGSGIVVPKAHRVDVFELTPDEWRATYELLHDAKAYLDDAHAPDGYTVGWNNGEAAGQTVFHVHLHVIPRFADEPLAGKGLRYWIKQPRNARPSSTDR